MPPPTGFDTRKCHDAAARGAAVIIPPRKNVKPWKADTGGAIARNEALRAHHGTSGRPSGDDAAAIHRRCRVEAKMHCVQLLGKRLTARNSVRSQSSRSLTPRSTASPHSELPKLKPWDKSVRGRESLTLSPFVQQSNPEYYARNPTNVQSNI